MSPLKGVEQATVYFKSDISRINIAGQIDKYVNSKVGTGKI